MKAKNQNIQAAAAKCLAIHNKYQEAQKKADAAREKRNSLDEDFACLDEDYDAVLYYTKRAHKIGASKKGLISKAKSIKKKLNKMKKLCSAKEKELYALDAKRDDLYDKFSNSGLSVTIAACFEMARLGIKHPNDKNLKQISISEEFAAILSHVGAKAALSFCK